MTSLDLSQIGSGHHLRYVGDVAVIILNDLENRLNLNSIGAMERCMDEVERNDSAKALVFTGIGKFFSNGIDLNWLAQQTPSTSDQYFRALKSFLIRVATFSVPTVAAINGHAFAGGAMLAFVCDFRVMHSGKGWLSLPEVHIKVPFTPFFSEIIEIQPGIPLGARKTQPRVDSSLSICGVIKQNESEVGDDMLLVSDVYSH